MAEKGARMQLEPVARRMYLDGQDLTSIAETLGVSRQTLSDWKARTKSPQGDGPDEWDRARMQKRGNIQRLRDLFERQLEYTENLNPAEVSAPLMDTLSKLGALIERWDRAETIVRKLADLERAASQPGGEKLLTIDRIREIREQIGL